VVDGVVFLVAQWSITTESIVWAMPMVLESWRALLKDLTAALGTRNVVSQTEILMQEK
jgi:hypothetical protein